MSALQQMLFAVLASTPPPVVAWSPSDIGANLTLSNGDLTVTKSSANGYSGVRATTPKSSGKHYFEVRVDAGTTSPFITIGVSNASETLADFTGSSASGWSYYEQTGTKVTNGSGAGFGASYDTGDVIGVAVDLDAGKVWFAKNGTWQASGNPAAGTGEAFSGLSGPLFPAVALHRGDSPAHVVTGRFKVADFTMTIPSGFAAWDS
jgi:hypothetical protein